MNSEIGFGRKVLQAFEENGISFEHVPSGIDTMTVFVHQDEFMHKERMCAYVQELLEGAGFSISSMEEGGISVKEDDSDDTFLIHIALEERPKDAED